MSSPTREFDLLLRSPSLIETGLAQEFLSEAGIPSLLHPQDSREAFVLSWNPLDAPDLYVPKGQGERAELLLRATWGEETMRRLRPASSSGEIA